MQICIEMQMQKKRFYHIYTLFCLQCVLYWGPAHLPRFFMTSFISVHAHIKILFRILYMHFVLLYMHHPTESFLLIKGLVLNYASKCNSIFLLFLISSMLEFFFRFVSSNVGGKLKLIQMHKLLCKIWVREIFSG